MHTERSLKLLFFTVCLVACGAPPPSVAPIATSEGGERSASGTDSFAVSGLRGTLSNLEIQGALEPRLPRMLRCVQQRRALLEPLAGTLALAFEVATDGSVVAVHPRESTLGDRDTERCILAVAQATRFPPPHGGDTDFGWPLEVDADEEVRPPVAVDPDPAREKVAAQAEALHAECGGGQMVVTMYVAPDGSVAAAGVAAPDGATEPQLDCVAGGVRRWSLPSPGSYLGKLSITLP